MTASKIGGINSVVFFQTKAAVYTCAHTDTLKSPGCVYAWGRWGVSRWSTFLEDYLINAEGCSVFRQGHDPWASI